LRDRSFIQRILESRPARSCVQPERTDTRRLWTAGNQQ